MKILFIENRYCTRIWYEVGQRLSSQGHEVAHMIQNPVFAPKNAQCFVLPFPSSCELAAEHESVAALPEKLCSDRAARYWRKSSQHYPHYKREISKVLDTFGPDVIFGEPTQFHELLTIDEARKRGILYLFPSATRYPPDRISFHLYDTMETFGGCGEPLDECDALLLRSAIMERRIVPGYMSEMANGLWPQRISKIKDKFRILRSWLAGERMVTPAPWRKVQLEYQHRALVLSWESSAQASLPKTLDQQPWVLYAMQMQPESNIDVWGFPWNDQVRIIRDAADALGAQGFKLVIKPNPKSKYELDVGLCSIAASHPHIVPLSHTCKMSDIFPHSAAVLSVSGTVILECVLSGKPVGVLGSHTMSRYPGVTPLSNPVEIASLAQEAVDGCARKATIKESALLLSQLHQSSYPGTPYDPLNQPELATTKNHELLHAAFADLLIKVERTPRSDYTDSLIIA